MSRATTNPTQTTSDTRRRLLDAAVAIFAERGFRRTTVRAICEKADANVAAVNYHFGNKAALYDAAFDHARLRSNESNPFVQMDKARDFHAEQPPERRLYLFIRTMLEHQFRDGQPTDLTRLMTHEMMQPTAALDRLIEVSVRRVHANLIQIILDLMPPPGSTAPGSSAPGSRESKADDKAREATARRYAMSVSAQCHFHHLALPMIQRLEPRQRYTPKALDDLAQHIHRFALAALRGLDTNR
jgi:TetR/AcrR family transcriptional regulator, regulator of cefoperazone and chloramphenicol sensitivity